MWLVVEFAPRQQPSFVKAKIIPKLFPVDNRVLENPLSHFANFQLPYQDDMCRIPGSPLLGKVSYHRDPLRDIYSTSWNMRGQPGPQKLGYQRLLCRSLTRASKDLYFKSNFLTPFPFFPTSPNSCSQKVCTSNLYCTSSACWSTLFSLSAFFFTSPFLLPSFISSAKEPTSGGRRQRIICLTKP